MNKKKLGKIDVASFGLGGYQGSGFGLHLVFEGDGWGVGFIKIEHDPAQIKHTERCEWTEADRDKGFAKLCRYVSEILDDAKKNNVHELVGTPVEVEFSEGGLLKDWRVLTEVL